jgi:hypothetical protein
MPPPRWLYRAGWAMHKAVDRITGGRLGTFQPHGGQAGVLLLGAVRQLPCGDDARDPDRGTGTGLKPA